MILASPSLPSSGASATGETVQSTAKSADLRRTAQEFETAFIAEMLKHAGFGQPRSGLGEGLGQDSFSYLMIDAAAKNMTAAGGFGLAESIFQSLAERAGVSTDVVSATPEAGA